MTISSFFIVIPAAFIVGLLGMLIVHRSQQKTLVKRQKKTTAVQAKDIALNVARRVPVE